MNALYMSYARLYLKINQMLECYEFEDFESYSRGIEVLDAIREALAHPMFD